eukprot:747642-Hanusia_phi.AAC.6
MGGDGSTSYSRWSGIDSSRRGLMQRQGASATHIRDWLMEYEDDQVIGARRRDGSSLLLTPGNRSTCKARQARVKLHKASSADSGKSVDDRG